MNFIGGGGFARGGTFAGGGGGCEEIPGPPLPLYETQPMVEHWSTNQELPGSNSGLGC